MSNYKIDSTIRIKSILIDLIPIIIISVASIILTLVLTLLFKWGDNILFRIFILSFIYSIIFCKDIIGGKSIGKHKCNLQIVNMNNSRVSLFKLIIRNVVFVFIWPIELIMCFVNPERRLADIVLGTKLIYDESERSKMIIEKKTYLVFIIVMLITTLLFYAIFQFIYASSGTIKLLYG